MILGISTSQSQFSIALGKDSHCLYQATSDISLRGRTSLASMLRSGLSELGAELSAIESIIVDIGPGGTSSVRTGVSFSNGLSYSMGIPVSPVSSVELIGMELFEKYSIPIMVLYKSVRKHFYYGTYDGIHSHIRYGTMGEIVEFVDSTYPHIVLVGYPEVTATLADLLQSCEAIDSGKQKVRVQTLIEKSESFLGQSMLFPNLPVPITENTI